MGFGLSIDEHVAEKRNRFQEVFFERLFLTKLGQCAPKGAPKWPKGDQWAPMVSQGHPKIITLAAFWGEVVQRGPGVSFGSIFAAFGEHCGSIFHVILSRCVILWVHI